jgi:uncharacterized protein (DUF427 family)
MAGMAVQMLHHVMRVLPELRYLPTLKHLTVRLGPALVADTSHAMLVWEPRRVVPTYAVPQRDVSASLVPAADRSGDTVNPVALGEGPSVLDPSSGFGAHTAGGESLDVIAGSATAANAAFRPEDPDLDGYLLLDFSAFDWWEEDQPIVSHPQDPFHRVDVRASSRLVRLEHQGVLLAESDRPQMLFEAAFPMARYYLPRHDVRVELLPSSLVTVCAYKGRATHYTAVVGGQELPDIAWSYTDPLLDATGVKGLISFYQERLDAFVDGRPIERPRTPWS